MRKQGDPYRSHYAPRHAEDIRGAGGIAGATLWGAPTSFEQHVVVAWMIDAIYEERAIDRYLARHPAAILLALAVVALAARALTFGNPVIGFDEQFYLLVGDRMLRGAVPYVDIFDRKPIGLFLIYAGAQLLGGGGFLAYKLVAAVSVVSTAFGLYRIACRFAHAPGAFAAAGLYILWLNLMEGEGGQSPVFYDLPMVVAALAVLTALDDPRRIHAAGMVAMASVGLALQIKYSVVIEGVFFGCTLIWLSWRDGRPPSVVGLRALSWIGLAVLPTLLALAWYVAIGHGREFIFCNFVSVLGQGRRPWLAEMTGLLEIVGILSPLAIGVAVGRPWRLVPPKQLAAFRFVAGWFATAIAGILLYGRFDSPHYAIPVLLPAVVLLAPVLGAAGRGAVAAILALVFVAGQTVLIVSEHAKGGSAAATAVATAARPGKGCLFVYDGYPALYMLTRSCLSSKWAFPGHMNVQDETGAAALGVDPSTEVRRILAGRPPVIVDNYPRFAFVNRATLAILQGALARDYHLAACIPTGGRRIRLVYRLGRNRGPAPRECQLNT